MASLYEQMAPGQAPAAAGSEGYQSNIVQGAARQLRPQYDLAIKKARQGMANRGQLRGGLIQEAEGEIGQDYRGQLADIASGAATRSADLGEAERVRQQGRAWNVEDMRMALEQRKAEMAENKAMQEQAMWADLIGSAVGAGGGALGSYLGRG